MSTVRGGRRVQPTCAAPPRPASTQQQRSAAAAAASSSRSTSSSPPVRVKQLRAGACVVNLLGTAGVAKPPGSSASSWIRYWEAATCVRRTLCCAAGCGRSDVTGSHVKLAGGPVAAALLHTAWYIVPACPLHNKGSSCKTYAVKAGTLAVEAPPSLGDRLSSWRADAKKLLATMR